MQMKRLFLFFVLYMSVVGSLFAQNEQTRISISNLSNNPTVKFNIENTLSKFFTELRSAYIGNRTPNLNSVNMESNVRQMVLNMWQTSPFRLRATAADLKVAERMGCYRVVDIVLNLHHSFSGPDQREVFFVEMDSAGKIIGFVRDQFPLSQVGSTNIPTNVKDNIVDFLQRLNTAHSSKDINFLEMVYSDNAVIYVGKRVSSSYVYTLGERSVSILQDKYAITIKNKPQYINDLKAIFASHISIDVQYDEIEISKHPTSNEKYKDVYYVRLKQTYRSTYYNNKPGYSDIGYLTLVWNFKNPNNPKILVRAWFDKPFKLENHISITIPTD